ncbi:unnamed protein product [Schistosoma turkestanicum]|nr:unnamed protein product [Schistosoma turkestanicum]
MPERINVGLCAFLLIAHGLQQKEGEPPMPQQCIGAGGVGGGFRQAVIKRSFHGTNLNEALGSLLGIQSYLVPVRRAFEHILRQLDTQVCRTMMLPKQEVTQKEFDELMTADRKPKLDLLKTCVACIPRLLPIDMTKQEILEILAKVCLHVDEDVRKMAQQAMANLIVELPAYRVKTIQVFIQFIQKTVPDTSPHQLDSCLKTLFHLLNNWKLALQKDGAVTPNMAEKSALYEAEGFALVMLCSCRLITRRLSVHILRKCRALSNLIQSATYDPTLKNSNDSREMCCIDVLDRSVPMILKSLLPILPLSERSALSSVSTMDFSIFTERSHPIWFGGSTPPVYSPLVLPANCLNNTQYSGLVSNNDVQSNEEVRFNGLSNLQDPNKFNNSNNSNNTGNTINSTTVGNLVSFNPNDKSKLDESVAQESFTKIARPSVSGLLIPSKSLDFRNMQTSKSYLSTTPVHRRASQYNQQIQHTQQAYIIQPTQENVAITDVWATCLSIVFNSSNLPTSCPMAIKSAWSILFQRISTIFPLIDPSAQIAENRASSLLRTGSKKPANEREQFIPLWHNYVVVGCCIAPSSTGLRISKPADTHYQPESLLQKHSPDFSTKDSNDCDNDRSPTQSDEVVNQMTDSNSTSSSNRTAVSNSPCTTSWSNSSDLKHSASFGKVNARDLVKLLVPLLRCEQPEIRDSAIAGLGRINPAAFRDVLEDLQPLLKESFDRKQENLRRRRRRDGLRSALVKTLSLMAQTGVFAYPESNIVTPQGSLICQLLDYMDGMRGYLESVSDHLLSPVSHTHQSSSSVNPLVSLPSGSTSQQVTAGGTISTNHQMSGSTNPNSVMASLSTPTTTGPSLASYSSEFYLLGEIRLHFCIFIKELIRRLPKQNRTTLLPSTLRHQLFILLSHWSAHHDHIMGTYLGSEGPLPTEPYFFDSNEHTIGKMSNPNGVVGFSPSNEIPPGIIGLHNQLSNDNFLQSLNSLGVNSVPSAGSLECSSNMSASSGQPTQSPTILQQKTCENEQIDRNESVEYCLWIDLIWLSNQAMAALVCCGPIFDRSALLPQDSGKLNQVVLGMGSDVSSASGTERGSGSNVCVPSFGYVLRWISGLLVARDTALSSSPWLWFCPIIGRGLLHSTLNPGGASLCGNSHTRSRIIAAGGGRRLDSLLRQLGEETLVLLLDFNSENTGLFNWVIDQCYTASNISLSTACFECICLIMSNIPNFACDHIVLITLCFVFMDHPSRFLSDKAFYLLRILYQRFIIEPGESLLKQAHPTETDKSFILIEAANSQSSPTSCIPEYCDCFHLRNYLKINKLFYHSFNHWSPCEVVRQFSAQHPDFTITIFSEISKRLENSREGLRVPLLRLLSIWLVNVELIDLVEDDLVDSTNRNIDKEDEFSDIDKNYYGSCSTNYEKSNNLPEPVGIPPFKANNTTNLLDASEQQQQSNISKKDFSEYRTRSSKRYKRSKSLFNSELLYDHDDTDADSDNIIDNRNFKSLTLLRMRARQSMLGEQTELCSPRSYHLSTPHNHCRNECKSNDTTTNHNDLHWSTVPPTLRSKGWGSKKATEFVLTNLFYLSLRLADCPTSSEAIKQLWLTLIRYRPTNLRVILRYLIIITSIAPGTLLAHVKRLLTYLASEQAESVIGELMVEMQTIDGIGLIVEPISSLPFFRVSTSTQHHHRQPTEEIKSSKFQSYVQNNSSSKTISGSSNTVNQEGIGQPDDELVALGLGSKPCSNTTTQARTLRSAIGGSYNYHTIDDNLNVKSSNFNVTVRPKSATCQPSTVITSTKRHKQTTLNENRIRRTTVSPTSKVRYNSHSSSESPQSEKSLESPAALSNYQLVEGSDGEPEIDVDSFEGFRRRGLTLDDKYATLRAKDIANLLTPPNPKDIQSSDSDSNCEIPNLCARGTTFPTTSDVHERSVYSSALSNPLFETNRLPTTCKITRQSKYSREYKEKRFSCFKSPKVDVAGSVPFHHSASLPPSLASLPPLPLPLPASISSILSLSSKGSTGSNTCILPISPVTADRKSTTSSDKSDIKPYTCSCVRRSSNVDVSYPSNKAYFDFNPKPLPMPATGGFHAPLGSWLSEPLVIGGSVVFSGSWPPAGPKSPLVLILAGGLTQSRGLHIDWSEHLPLMLLGVFLGIDHCRALVQEESKQLLVSLLDQVCPHHDMLRLLRLELEANLHRLAYPSGFPGPRVQDYRLTLDGGPYREKFNMVLDPLDFIERDQLFSSSPVSSAASKHDRNNNFKNRLPAEDEETRQTTSSNLMPLKDINVTAVSAASLSSPSTSPPIIENYQTHPTMLTNQGQLSGSMFSLTSTATLIPRHHENNLFESQTCNDSSIPKHNSVCYNSASNNSEKEFLRNKSHTNAVTPSSVYSKPRSSKSVISNSVPSNNHYSSKIEKTKRFKKSDLKLLEKAILQLKSILLNSSGQAIWTWEDFNVQHNSFGTTTVQYCQNEFNQIINNEKLENKESVIKSMNTVNSLEQLVKLVARILALSEAGSEEAEKCLQCLHGPPHDHNNQSLTMADDDYKDANIDHSNYCMVARLSQIALNTGLSCPSRHLASRSLQIHRALGGHLDKKSFSKLLARLGETVSDGSEEIQGYVAELFLTQEAAIHHLKSKSDSFLESVPQFASEPTSPSPSSLSVNGRKSALNMVSISDRRHFHRHSKSSSLIGNRSCHLNSIMPANDYSVSKLAQSTSPTLEHASPTSSFPSDSYHLTKLSNTSSTSTPKPNNNDNNNSNNNSICLLPPGERADLIIGIFWTGVLLLESDFENEYLVGLKLLNLVIPSVCASNLSQSSDGLKINLGDKAQKMLDQLHWNPYFPGILSLVIKGCSSPNLVDQSCRLLVLLIPFLSHPLVVPTGRMGLSIQLSFPIVLLTLMPMLTTAWDEDPSTSVPANPCDTNSEQLSFLQGGFLGRGICGSLNVIPRALGSWTSSFCTPYTSYTNQNTGTNSKIRTDSIGLFANCPSNSLGTFSAYESTSNLSTIVPGGTSRDVQLTYKSPILRPKNPICIQAAESLAQAALKADPIQFSNLALILRLYASGSFSKDVDQWSRCVICYLLEGCSSNTSRLLKHINMLLTSGPPCLQLPLLKVAHLFLQQVDMNQRDTEYSLQNFITSIVNQFVGTCLWTHVIPILQVTVSRSAVLNSVPETPAYTLPGLDPSGSGRVLDYAIASAAVAVPLPDSEPPRLELGGPVLDFTFNVLQEAPLLAPQFAPPPSHLTSENISKVDIPTFDHTPLKPTKKDFIDVHDIGLIEMFVSASTGWNKPGNSQIRLREKLYGLVSCYGLPPQQCISAPRSPSVIFSQSTETLDPQLSIHSSSETTSVVDISNSDDIRLDDTSSGEQTAVFRDLDTYLDAQLMNINFLGVPDCRLASTNASTSEEEPRRPWGVRGQAITCHFDFNGDGNESITNESVGGLFRTIQPTDKTASSLAHSITESDYFTAAYQPHHSQKQHQNRTHSLPHLTYVTDNSNDIKDTESSASNTNRYSTITISNNYTDDSVDGRYSPASYSEQPQLLQSEDKKPSNSLSSRPFIEEQLNYTDNDLTIDESVGEEKFNKGIQVMNYPRATVRSSRSERVTFNLDGDKSEDNNNEVGRQDDEVHRQNKVSMADGVKGILINRSNHESVKELCNGLLQSNTVLPNNSVARSLSTQSLNNDGNYDNPVDEKDISTQSLRSSIYFPRCLSSNRNEGQAKYSIRSRLTSKPEQTIDNRQHDHDHLFVQNSPTRQIKRSVSTSELLLTRPHFTINNKSDDYNLLVDSLVLSPLNYQNYHMNDKYFTHFSSSLSSTRSLSPLNQHNQSEQRACDLVTMTNDSNANSNTDMLKISSCRPNSLCSLFVRLQSNRLSLSPTLTAPSVASVHSSHLSLHCSKMIRKSNESLIGRKHKATSDSHLNCFNKQILCTPQQSHQSNDLHRSYHEIFSRVSENTCNVTSSECTSLNKLVSVQPAQSLCNWRYPLITEQKWIAWKSASNSTSSHLNEQKVSISLLMELPQLYQELISRYMNAVNHTINLSVSHCTKSSRFNHLEKLVEKIRNYLRPPWFFCRLPEDYLNETVRSCLISKTIYLLEKHEEIQNQFEELYNLLQSENAEDTFIQLLSHMFTNLIEFVKYSCANVETVYVNISKLKEDEILLPVVPDQSCRFHCLLQCILSGLNLSIDNDNNNVPIEPTNCNESAALKNQLCEFLTTMLTSLPNDELLTGFNKSNPENCKEVIRLYKQLSDKSPNGSEVPIDIVTDILNIFANYVLESDSSSYIAYLPLPALDKDVDGQSTTINYCAYLTESLHQFVLNDDG